MPDQAGRARAPAVWITRRGVNSGKFGAARFGGVFLDRDRDVFDLGRALLGHHRETTRLRCAPSAEGRRLTPRTSGSASGSARRTATDQRRAGGEVGDVVLAQIDEGEAEGQRVGPARRARAPARLGQGDRADQRRREVQRGHRRPGVAAERVVHPRPGAAPEVLADLDHDATDLLVGQALLGGPPGRRRRRREVDDAAGVEDGGEPARGAREMLRGGGGGCRAGRRRARRTRASGPRSGTCSARRPRASGRAPVCRRTLGRLAEPDRAVDRRSGTGSAGGCAAARGRRREARGP